VWEVAERAYFVLCRGFGQLLRGARYCDTRVVSDGGEVFVRKQRAFYAPLLVWSGEFLVRFLAVDVHVLPGRAWAKRERLMYEGLYGTPVRIDADGALMLPYLPGNTLANVLEDRATADATRHRAMELGVLALADLHARGFTHADAMAENVMVDLDAGVARWFDFETVHDPSRPMTWRRADDVRALLATCLLRTAPDKLAETLDHIIDVYADDAIVPLLARRYSSVFRRSLTFHLGQAGLSFESFQEIGRLLRRRRHGPVVA
jgi:hypothetical protein